jgi:hypothetical protein
MIGERTEEEIREIGPPANGNKGAVNRPWHALSGEQALAILESSLLGLTNEQAEQRLREHDGNALPEPKRQTLALGDRVNMAFAGATVTTGRGTGVVVATGIRTEIGQIAREVTQTEATKPPLVIRMERFVLALVGLIDPLRPPRRQSEGVFNRLMIQQTALSGIVMGLITFGLWCSCC